MIRLALVFALFAGAAMARDSGQWADQDAEVSAWFRSLMQPDNPAIPCCSYSDAYYADKIIVRDGNTFAVITDDRADAPLGRPHIDAGTEFLIPNSKLKWDRGNPTGHNIIFVSPSGLVWCFVQTTGI